MNYRTVDLEIDKEKVRQIISKEVSGVISREIGADLEYRTPSGFHVATFSEITLLNGQQGTRLKYRSVIISATAANARRKAHQIREAVIHHQYRK